MTVAIHVRPPAAVRLALEQVTLCPDTVSPSVLFSLDDGDFSEKYVQQSFATVSIQNDTPGR